MKLVVVIAILAAFTHQQCSKGCLRCSSANVCLVCDVTNSYYAFNNTCAASNQTNCAVLSQSGACVSCSSGYYVDSSTSRCVAVPTNNTFANCAAYSGSIACTGCASGYYISSGACVLANTTVANCDLYSANGVCSSCRSGFIFSYNNSLCVPLTAASNCQQYTYAGCTSCNSGYILNRNLFYSAYTSTATGADWVYAFSSGSGHVPLLVCQAITVTNCAVLLNYNTCQTCSDGYYLSSGACVANPAPVIANCATYSSLTTCTSCNPNFFLSNGACSAIIPIPFCVTYSTTANPTTCIACNATSFVSNNACAARTITNVANCASYTPNADTCASCNTGFRLTTNGQLCLAVIANCLTYATWNTGDTAFTCSVCANTFALTTTNGVTTCPSGTIANCARYTSSTVCATCANGYYLANNVCTQHVSITGCSVYSQSVANTCVTCGSGTYLFAYEQTCVAISTVIQNCLLYESTGDNCIYCATGYWLSSPTACTAIDSTTNCVARSNTGCTACAANYVLNTKVSPSTCIAQFDFVAANCDTLIDSTQVAYSAINNICYTCKTNFLPFNPYNSEPICVKTTDYVAFYGNSNWQVTDCLRYGLNYPTSGAGVLVCNECVSGKYIVGYETNKRSSSGRTCGTCNVAAGSGNLIIADDLLGTVNICVAGAVANFGVTGTNYNARVARTKFGDESINDYQVLATVAGYLPRGLVSGQFPIEAPSSSVTTPLSTSTDYIQGLSPLSTDQTRPSVFFWRGQLLDVTIATVPTTAPTPNWTTNCAIIYNMPATGSISVSGGAFSGYWAAITTAADQCLRCAPGFQLSFLASNPAPTASANIAIPICTAVANCADNNQLFGGLPTYLNNLLSCHSCSAGNSPIVAFEYSAFAVSGVLQNKFLNFRVLSTVTLTGAAFTCGATPATVIKDDTTTAAALAGCGVYGNLVAMTDNTAKTAQAAQNFCLACATGFVPTYRNTAALGGATSGSYIPYFAVTACTASTNCDATATVNFKPFNACGRCSIASVSATPPVYYAYADHTFANCLPSWSNNCFILNGNSFSASTANPCKICSSGYYLNQDGYCDTISVPNQAASSTFATSYYVRQFLNSGSYAAGWDSIHVRVHYGLSFWASQYGVSACASNYVRAPAAPEAPVLCVASAYLTNNVAQPTDANLRKFIPNCIKYASPVGNAIPPTAPLYVCQVCATGKIPVITGASCVNSIANCQFALDSDNTKCAWCNSGWWNVQGACSQATVANCATLQNGPDTSSSTLGCQTCNAGYYVTPAKTCTQGTIANCKSYSGNNGQNCNQCNDNFVLVEIASSTTYCYPVPTSIGCNLVDNSASNPRGLKQGYISCQLCQYQSATPKKAVSWSSQTTTTLAQNVCWAFSTILNCQTYDQSSSTLASNTFKCTACNTGFFLSNGGWACTARTVQPSNCATYVADQDKCASCNAGFFLNVAQNACVAFPIGVPNCVKFSAPTNCTQCAAGYYVSSGNCLASTTTVTNCAIYSGNNTCANCSSGYYMTNATVCTQATATNCLTYASATACASCAFGWALTTANAITSCNQISVSNCAMLSAANQNNCGVCSTNFYLNSAGVCTAVTTTISNCLYYSAADKCANCTAGYTLTADQTACSNTFTNVVDANCANSFLQNNAACARCAYGYVWGSSGCTQCAAYSSGCAICDSANTTNCLLCQPTYYMNQNFTCVANPAPTNNTPTPTPTPTPTTPSGVERMTFWSLAVALIMTLFGMN